MYKIKRLLLRNINYTHSDKILKEKMYIPKIKTKYYFWKIVKSKLP